ncbi:MAG: hypothetical protein WD069_08855 [Planctomycetales bacterium]
MDTSHSATVLDRLLDPVTECLTADVARRIVNLELDPALQSKLDDLAAKAAEGTLSPTEADEYREFVEGIDIVGILKAKARASLRAGGR